jgi:preprotein translocase subunit Sec61beta
MDRRTSRIVMYAGLALIVVVIAVAFFLAQR